MHNNLFDILEKFKLPIALSFLGLILIIGGVFSTNFNKQKSQEFPKESIVASQKTISVDVSGAILKSGVYDLPEDSRIEDAIQKAGGFSENANQEYITKRLNLAQKLVDGSKIYIPQEGEGGSIVQAGVVAGESAQVQININSSSQAELEALPGVGPVTAAKIISGRPYQTIEDLLSKKSVSKAVFEKIKDLVVLY